jgi:tetratricopeptide (TPR) repeat protein
MKKIVLILSLFIVSTLCANKHDENFYKAVKLFNAGEYQEALTAYESLQLQGPITYYNTGIVLYQLKQYGKALAAWRKAQLYASPALLKKIEHNAAQAREKLGLSPDSGWYISLIFLQSHCSLFILQCLFLLVWLGWYVSLFFTAPLLQKLRPFLLVFSFCFVSLIALKYMIVERTQGIVIVSDAKVFTGPNIEFHELASLKEGEQVKVVDQEESWYKMHYRDINGWMRKDDVQAITL